MTVRRKKAAEAAFQDRYVAVCDILGFRELMQREGSAWVADRYRQLERSVRLLCQWDVRARIFSDTIFLYGRPLMRPDQASQQVTEIVNWERTTGFIGVVACAITTSLTLGLPLRAGVAYGECLVDPDRQLFLGDAIVDAHEAESDQDWIGVGLHSSAFRWMSRQPQDGDFWRLTRYDVPTKPGSTNLEWSVNWAAIGQGRADLREALARFQIANAGTEHESRWRPTSEYYDYCVRRPEGLGGYGDPVQLVG